MVIDEYLKFRFRPFVLGILADCQKYSGYVVSYGVNKEELGNQVILLLNQMEDIIEKKLVINSIPV